MAKRIWTFELEDGNHTVELEHGYMSGKRIIRVDGELLEQSSKVKHFLFDMGSRHPFQVNGHTCAVIIRTNGITFRYDLEVDGRSIKTGQQVPESQPIPTWGWLFIVGCGIIPVVSLGGAIPAVLGVGGAAGCASIARDASGSTETRVIMCVGVTVLCWTLFLAVVGSVAICGL